MPFLLRSPPLPLPSPSTRSPVASEQAHSVEDAFRQLFDRDYAYVWQSLRRLGVEEGDVDDLASEVFVKVHERFGDYDPARPSRPWLFAFCARLASDYRRLARHRREAPLDRSSQTPLVATDPEGDARLVAAERRALLFDALDVLDDERRQVFVLHELEERPIPEVARILGIPVPTAYTRLRAARRLFTDAARRLAR